MKWVKGIFAGIFGAMLVLPMLFFNFKREVVSEIDNRMLAGNPFTAEGDLERNIEDYINDRIGFRDEMILAHTILNDKLFGKMEHPMYTYGRSGHVFGAGVAVNYPYSEYHQVFAQTVKRIQDYCEVRGIPFLFVFEPAKPAVYPEYIAKGVRHDRSWVDSFLNELDTLGVRYVDNTQVLREKKEAGEVVFNKKYDVNHWNSLGAYYGTKAALTELQKSFPNVHVTEWEELQIEEEEQTSLLVSKFPIKEKTPKIDIKGRIVNDISEKYREELYRDPSFQYFSYLKNEALPSAPKGLIFQGSYMNGKGSLYFSNAFREYIAVHDYQNVLNFPYYINIFQPECVVFEVAEYTVADAHFSYDKMKNMHINPFYQALTEAERAKLTCLEGWTVERGNALTKLTVEGEDGYAWLQMSKTYEMQRTETGYEVTVTTEEYDKYNEQIKIELLKTA